MSATVVIRCDMCGLKVESVIALTQVRNFLEKNQKWTFSGDGDYFLDFCPECTRKRDRFIELAKLDEEK